MTTNKPMPSLAELEAKIERRELCVKYANSLILAVAERPLQPQWEHTWLTIALTRLTETEKVQAALKVLNS